MVSCEKTDRWKNMTKSSKILIRKSIALLIFSMLTRRGFLQVPANSNISTEGRKYKWSQGIQRPPTLLVAANMTGTEKLPILIIGKLETPRCLKNIIRTLRALYKWDHKARMTSNIF
ncbi:tigger transposable element-derived protein 6 [Plakobranchus ocellatus]|uniref:Tigger transposable element-derived protein 6 n=1 Tax=Plakobranchus ocellatus TaxID=259542 RepID=A0AAV3Z0C3_9GAST|nr:tigger transposable element-derived protein 6 [Plakobranchus ocellatus]